MRPRVVLVGVVLITIVVGIFVVPKAFARITADGSPSARSGVVADPPQAPAARPASPTLRAAPVTLDTDAPFWSWALLDRRSGELAGSANFNQTNTTESMIKVWLVSDYLRHHPDPDQATLRKLSSAIRDSDDTAAQWAYRQGGSDAVVRRLVTTCGLTDTTVHSGWWSLTKMSARDAVRMGNCIADGRAAGPKWTDWVLSEMRQVRGTVDQQQERSGGGRWGIIDALPADTARTVAIKNGWTPQGYDGRWHINCLAVTDDWVLAVQAQYPYGKWPSGAAVPEGLDKGAGICRQVTEQLLTTQP
ncbi:MAG TPA: serine hydrolase [Micromonosporaceae bacterium]|nr:serine hydrolase [Micromonosporaceae bacterium]